MLKDCLKHTGPTFLIPHTEQKRYFCRFLFQEKQGGKLIQSHMRKHLIAAPMRSFTLFVPSIVAIFLRPSPELMLSIVYLACSFFLS